MYNPQRSCYGLSKMKRGRRLAWPAVLAAALSACALMPEDNVVPPPLIPPVQITYNTIAVGRDHIFDTVRTTGMPIARERHGLRLENVGGNLVAVHVRQYSEVYAGQVLMEFDTEDLRRSAEQLRRDLEMAELAHRNAMHTFTANQRAYQDLIVSTEQDRRLANARWAQAREQYFINNTITELQFMEAETTHLQTMQRLDSNLESSRVRSRDDTEVIRTRNALAVAQEKLREVESKMENFTLVSPIDGVVVHMPPRPLNEFVRPGELIIVIADISEYFVEITGSTAREFRAGTEVFMEAQIRNLDGPGRTTAEFEGIVVSASVDLRQQTGVTDAAVLVEAWEWPDRLGLTDTVIVFFVREARHNTIVIPLNAVTEFSNYAFVRVYQDGSIMERQVELGIRDRTRVEVISGLQEGELIVVR
jgi:multidrug efflux pump subunit AcrA (membrane-fusion protein)